MNIIFLSKQTNSKTIEFHLIKLEKNKSELMLYDKKIEFTDQKTSLF